MKRRIVIAALVLVLAVIAPLVRVPAQSPTVPALINYQGRLVDAEGIPLETADRDLVIRIYDHPSSEDPSSLKWGPQEYTATPVVKGYYNLLLGARLDPEGRSIIEAFTGEETYLEVTVNDEPMSPRQRIVSAPYAFRAHTAVSADTLGGTARADIQNEIEEAVQSHEADSNAHGIHSIDGSQITSGTIAKARVPNAGHADTAGTATNATNAATVTGTQAAQISANTDLRQNLHSGFSAYRSGSVWVTNNEKIVMNAEFYDFGTNYATSTGTYTAPRDGVYQFNISISTHPSAAGTMYVELLVNGNAVLKCGNKRPADGPTEMMASGSYLLQLSEGQRVTLRAVTSMSGGFRVYSRATADDSWWSTFSGRLVAALDYD